MKIFYRGQHFSLIYNSLEAIIRMKKVATSINSRAQLILMMMNSRTDSFISKELSCTRDRVKRWRTRALELFNKWEYKDTNEKKAIEDILLILSDKYRCGAPSVFTAENICLIVSIALRQPSEFGLPISNWSSEDLAVEVKKQGILELISASTISRILRDASIKPHKSDYWLNPKIEDAAEFAQRVKDICEIYANAKKWATTNTILVSVDEKTGMQATERCAPDKPIMPGSPVKIEYEYTRHGCRCLTPSFDVSTGKIIAYQLGETRTALEFVQHIKDTVATSPDSNWVFVMDQLNTHKSVELVEYFSEINGFTEELGVPRRSGILENQKTRMEFLSRKNQKLRIQYTPKHCSWMNQIEIWFGIFHRKALRRASFSSIEKLIERVEAFIKYYNVELAHPFKWTYMGKALVG